jgi:hypothetical protein
VSPFFRRAYLFIENIIMTILVPQQGPGPIFHWVFKIPLLLQKIGLTELIPRNVLILTTRGRRTGRPRRTPMEYGPGPHGEIMVMSGWEGRTDWCGAAIGMRSPNRRHTQMWPRCSSR